METTISATVQPVSSDGEQWMRLLRNKPEDFKKLQKVKSNIELILSADAFGDELKILVTNIMCWVELYHTYFKPLCVRKTPKARDYSNRLKRQLSRLMTTINEAKDELLFMNPAAYSAIANFGIPEEIFAQVSASPAIVAESIKANEALLDFLNLYYVTGRPIIRARYGLAYRVACEFQNPVFSKVRRIKLGEQETDTYYLVLRAIILGLEEDKEAGQKTATASTTNRMNVGVKSTAKEGRQRFNSEGHYSSRFHKLIQW